MELKNAVDEAGDVFDTGNYISLTMPEVGKTYLTILILGSEEYVESKRSYVLSMYSPIESRSVLLLGTLFGGPETSIFLDRLNQVAALHNVEIIIDNNPTVDNQEPVLLSGDWFVHLVGSSNQVNAAEQTVRILVSYLLLHFKHYIEKVDVCISQVPAIGGQDLAIFSQFALQSGANIFIPDVLQNLYGPASNHTRDTVSIWITAKSVLETHCAKQALESAIKDTCAEFATQEIVVPTHSKEHIILHHQAQLLNIMFERGVFIQLDHLGSLAKTGAVSSVTEGLGSRSQGIKEVITTANTNAVIGATCTVAFQSSAVNSGAIKDAIADFCSLYKDNYTLKLNLKSSQTRHHRTIAMLYNIVRLKVSCSASLSNHVFTVIGGRFEIKQILTQINDALQFDCGFSEDITSGSISLDIETEHRDFVSGKKNGKLTKIIAKSHNAITFTLGDVGKQSFPLSISLADMSQFNLLSSALLLLEQELPAQVEFNVPEVYHKSIIGNGGGLIQSILKRLNVFIKFSTLPLPDRKSRHYTFHRENNVLVKCPHKNGQNIAQAKLDIGQLVQKYCADNQVATTGPTAKRGVYCTSEFELLRGHYILLVESNRLGLIKAMEPQLGVFIDFPLSLNTLGSRPLYTVKVRGPANKVDECVGSIVKLMPKTYEFRLTQSPARFDEIFISAVAEFNERLAAPLHMLLGVQVTAFALPIGGRDSPDPYHQILLSYCDDNKLEEASKAITAFLREKGFLILTKGEIARNFILKKHISTSTTEQAPVLKPLTNVKIGRVHPKTISNIGSMHKRKGKRGLSLMQGIAPTADGVEFVYQTY